MSDTAAAARLVQRFDRWAATTFVVAVIRRFIDLEILDRSLAMAAQAFVALLPLEIVLVGAVFTDGPDAITNALGDRFGLDTAARSAIRMLFAPDGAQASISWLAVVLATVSALALSRRLSRSYGAIFDVPPAGSREVWRGLVWIVMQLMLLIATSWLRNVRVDNGVVVFAWATAGMVVLWALTDIIALRLLVPKAPIRFVVQTAMLATVGRFGIGLWAVVYMPHALTEHAAQYGPIGVTFLIFTYLFAAVLLYLSAPLIVTTWASWRSQRRERAVTTDGDAQDPSVDVSRTNL